MKSQLDLPYHSTPTLPVETTVTISEEQFRVIDATIATNVISVYAKRYGHAAALKLIETMARKYATS